LKYQIAPKVPDSSQKITVRLLLNACRILKNENELTIK
jgi:hypothetical protein